jgi:hypothetical protein
MVEHATDNRAAGRSSRPAWTNAPVAEGIEAPFF